MMEIVLQTTKNSPEYQASIFILLGVGLAVGYCWSCVVWASDLKDLPMGLNSLIAVSLMCVVCLGILKVGLVDFAEDNKIVFRVLVCGSLCGIPGWLVVGGFWIKGLLEKYPWRKDRERESKRRGSDTEFIPKSSDRDEGEKEP